MTNVSRSLCDQVFHVCQHDGRKSDFLCPVGTIFNQEIFVCDWWQNFRCQDTPNFYQNNDELYKTPARAPEVASNLLRKRTDIEREDEPPFSDEGREETDAAIDSRTDSASDEEEEDPRPPAPVVPAAAVKGYSDLPSTTAATEAPTSRSADVKSARGVAGYGARMTRKRLRVESLATAASKVSLSAKNDASSSSPASVAADRMSTAILPLPVN